MQNMELYNTIIYFLKILNFKVPTMKIRYLINFKKDGLISNANLRILIEILFLYMNMI